MAARCHPIVSVAAARTLPSATRTDMALAAEAQSPRHAGECGRLLVAPGHPREFPDSPYGIGDRIEAVPNDPVNALDPCLGQPVQLFRHRSMCHWSLLLELPYSWHRQQTAGLLLLWMPSTRLSVATVGQNRLECLRGLVNRTGRGWRKPRSLGCGSAVCQSQAVCRSRAPATEEAGMSNP